MSDDRYFATLPREEIGKELIAKVETYYDYLKTSGILKLIRKSYRSYFGLSPSGTGSDSFGITKAGEQGELSTLWVNHYRNLIQHMLALCLSSKEVMDPIATNSDQKSLSQTILARGLLDYYNREKKVERLINLAAEYSLVLAEGFIKGEWDATAGEVYGVNPDTKTPMREGDLKFTVLSLLDVPRDPYRDNTQENDWLMSRVFKNKYELAAKYPELKDKILALDSNSDTQPRLQPYAGQKQSNDVPVFEFYHRRSDAVPDGRYVAFLSSDVVLLDGALPYRAIPVFKIASSEWFGTPFGHSGMFDLLSINEALSALVSVVVTNQSTFGVQNVLVPKGHDLSVTQLAGGLNLIEYDSKIGKPEPLNLTQTPSEIFNFIGMLEKMLETISGISSIVRGTPEKSLQNSSGAAMALLSAQAVQFASGLQASKTQLMEDVGTFEITTLRDYASVPRIAMIAGKQKRYLMKQFTGDDLDQINRVVVQSTNPLSKTTSGKLQIAQDLLQHDKVTADQYLQVATTGTLEPLIESEQANLMRIRSENEALAEGRPVNAIAIDPHWQDIPEHMVVLSSQEARNNPAILKNTFAHLGQHLDQYRAMDPAICALLGGPPPPPPPMMQQPMAGPAPQQLAGPPHNSNSEKPNGAAAAMLPPANDNSELPSEPSFPKNPATGQQWNPQTGGA